MRADLPWAVMPPEAAVILVRDHGDVLRAFENRARIFALGGNRGTAQALSLWVAQTKQAARSWVEEQRSEAASQAGDGSSELPMGGKRRESVLPIGGATGLTTGQVAKRLGVGPRRVIQMIGVHGSLLATRHRGRWVIDEVSVAEELERRRNR